MIGRHGGVSTLLKADMKEKKIPELLVIGCPCHLINLCAKKAAKVLPAKVEEVLVDVFYFFKHSEKKKVELGQFQSLYNEDVKKILKYCPTRWLSLSPCLKRLLELWQPLFKYISSLVEKKQEKEKKKKKATDKKAKESEDAIISSWFNDDQTVTTQQTDTRLHRLHDFLG